MQIINIKESSRSNILRWSIANNVDIRHNRPIMSLVNDELFYLVTIDGINFYELFRLTQKYRNKIKVVKLSNIEPSVEDLQERFRTIPVDQIVDLLNHMIGLTNQMNHDIDIIESGSARLFLPMITNSYAVQIPFSFADFIESINDDEAFNIFNQQYPDTLNSILNDNEFHILKSQVLKSIAIDTLSIKYDDRYENLLNVTKYSFLNKHKDDESLFKHALIGFHKYDNVNRSITNVSLFKGDKNYIGNTINTIKRIRTPLIFDFVIQLPIMHMQMLESSFYPEDISISYRSSITNIIDNGIVFHNFTLGEQQEDGSYANSTKIDAYKLRISEMERKLMNIVSELFKDISAVNGNHPTSIVALLPSIYLTNAVVSIDENVLSGLSHTDFTLSSLFDSMRVTGNKILLDINKK